jgi:hypothetical protein
VIQEQPSQEEKRKWVKGLKEKRFKLDVIEHKNNFAGW